MIDGILHDLGLTSEEIEIYQSLLINGSQPASRLAKTTKVKRTYIYNVVDKLMKRGLVSQSKKYGALYFVPLSPDKLLGLVQKEKEKVERVEQTLESLLPILRSKYALSEDKPVVTYYEGIEGVKKVYLDTIKKPEPILALVETTKLEPKIYEWLTTDYIKRRVKKNISVKSIVASGSNTKTYVGLNREEIRETKIIPSDKFPFQNEIIIYGNKVAIINHNKDSNKLLGIMIENSNIINTFRSWFNLTWSLL